MVAVTPKSRTISNGDPNDATPVEASFVELYNNDSTLATEVTNIGDNAYTFTGEKTFGDGLKTDTISEETSGSGVTVDGLLIKDAGIAFSDAGELTISSGAITATGTYHTVDTEGDAASDDLDTINGGVAGKLLTIQIEADARDVVIKHNTGNIFLGNATDFTIDTKEQSLTLVYSAALSKWVEIGRSNPLIATQAQQEAGNSTAALVTPGRQQYHPSAAKAWALINQTGTQAIIASYGVSSISDLGTGSTRITFTTAFSNANNYGGVASSKRQSSNSAGKAAVYARTTTTADVIAVNDSGAAEDSDALFVVFYGDQ